MAEIVNLAGMPVEGELPSENEPIDVLRNLLAEFEAGSVTANHLMVIIEGTVDKSETEVFTYSSQMTTAQASLLTAVAHQLIINDFVSGVPR